MPGAQGPGSASGGDSSGGPHTGRNSPAIGPSGIAHTGGPASHGYGSSGGGYLHNHSHPHHAHGHPHHGYNPPGPSHLSQMIPPYTIPPAGPGSAPSSSPRSYGNSTTTTPSRGGPLPSGPGQTAPSHPHSLAHHSLSQPSYARDGPSGPPPPPLGSRFDGDRPSSQPLLGDFTGEPSGGESLVVSPAGMDDDDDDELQDDATEGGPGAGSAGGAGGHGGAAGSAKRRRPHMARRRIVQSCSECRRRKIKCDKKFPCGPCVLRGDQKRCHEVGMAEKSVASTASTYATNADLANVAHRLDALEAALVKNGSLTAAEIDSFLKTFRHGGDTFDGPDAHEQHHLPERKPSDIYDSGALAPRGPESVVRSDPRPLITGSGPTAASDASDMDDTEGAALTLEHLAFGRSRAEGSHALPHFGSRGFQSSASRGVANNNYHLARSSSLARPGSASPAGSSSPADARKASMSLHGPARSGSITDLATAAAAAGRAPARAGSLSETGTLDRKSSGAQQQQQQQRYGAELSDEERRIRIDALLDLIGPTDVFDMFYRKTDVAMIATTKVLPSREKGEILVRTYLEKVDFLHRCLHVPTFMRQCQDLWSVPPELVTQEIALPFVALYFTTCTLGLQFMDASEVSKLFTDEEIRTLPDLWFSAARSTMWAADFVGSHQLEHLQSLILLSVFLNNRDRGEASWALLGAAIKMAQGLGLNRLGAEQQAPEGKLLPMWTGRWESLIQREVGRRIWWNLVFLDWAMAPSYSFSCSIHPDQIKTALPANIDDEDIIDGQKLQPKPLTTRTSMSFILARYKFAEITHRQIWQANLNMHPPYSFILSVDAELRKAMMELPAFFQPDASDREPPSEDPKSLVQYYEKILLNLAIHSRMLRLHRPWLSRGYADERFAYSKEQCIRAARASLRMMADNSGTAALLEKWWIPLFYVSVSGLVVIIDLLRTARKDMMSRDTEAKINEVRGALDQMRQIADVSHPSRAAVKVMDFLLAEVEERRRPPGSTSTTLGKRKASPSPEGSNDDGLQRAVKKLIRQAQLEADSPIATNASHGSATPVSAARLTPSPQLQGDSQVVFDAYPLPTPTTGVMPAGAAGQQAPGVGAAGVPSFTIDAADGPSGPAGGPRQSGNGLSGGQGGLAGTESGKTGPSVDTNALYVPTNPTYQALSPFTFPLDPTTSTSAYPPPAALLPMPGTPQLDPAIEAMLASYFPQQGQASASGPPGGSQTQPNNAANMLAGGHADGLGAGPGQQPFMGAGFTSGTAGQAASAVPDDFLTRVFGMGWDMGTGSSGQQQQQQQQQHIPQQGSSGGMPGGRGSLPNGGGTGADGFGGTQGSMGASNGSGMDDVSLAAQWAPFEGWSSAGWMA